MIFSTCGHRASDTFYLSAFFGDFNKTFARQRLEDHEQVGDATTLVLVVLSVWCSCRNGKLVT